ncbi:hypothetical protein DM872_21810 [Pseudomonas taiwanensis]|uniref:transglycosylase SLT domain-containing protein n=1 Tax=Pseudomonas taiwanensis TaxID=470150 RepID=UPI0015B9C833|nr:hypothetical protein [Pseudomonas taiwanensis]NWL79491.1 hypothetical protein [Pseudomonas taiwanensis]
MRTRSELCAIASLLVALSLLAGCATAPPRAPDNLCAIFREYPDWYEDALEMEVRWGTPIPVAMAIVDQESSYRHDARPPRDYLLGFIPWGRVTSAYGYAQALDATWADYQQATGSGGSRTSFSDAMDFIGWYTDATQRQLGISKWDAHNQYLAYHEGRGGYRRGSYWQKPWLTQVARKVDQQSRAYGSQLASCRAELEDDRGWWPF